MGLDVVVLRLLAAVIGLGLGPQPRVLQPRRLVLGLLEQGREMGGRLRTQVYGPGNALGGIDGCRHSTFRFDRNLSVLLGFVAHSSSFNESSSGWGHIGMFQLPG